MSVMTKSNSIIESIFGASERELLTLSLAEIIDGLMQEYKSFSRGIEAGINIPDSKAEPRMSHSCILYAEGLRLAHTHLELAKKLIFASLLNFNSTAREQLERKAKEEKYSEKVNPLDALVNPAGHNIQAFAWIKANGEAEQLEKLLREIDKFEDSKENERKLLEAAW